MDVVHPPHHVGVHRDGRAWRYTHACVILRDPRVKYWWSASTRTWYKLIDGHAEETTWTMQLPEADAFEGYAVLPKPTTFRHDPDDPGAPATRPAKNQQ